MSLASKTSQRLTQKGRRFLAVGAALYVAALCSVALFGWLCPGLVVAIMVGLALAGAGVVKCGTRYFLAAREVESSAAVVALRKRYAEMARAKGDAR